VYVSGVRMKGTATISLSPVPPQGVTISYLEGGTATTGTFRSASPQQVPAGQSSFSVSVEADAILPAMRAQFINPLNVSWRVGQGWGSCDNPMFTCVEAGSSSNPVYVTLEAPKLPPAYEPLLLSYLSIAIGDGGATNQTEAFASTWARFSTGNGPADVSTWMGEFPIYYPANVGFESCTSSAEPLLTTNSGRGQCNSFAQLFLSALAANGMPVTGSPNTSSPAATTTGVCVTDNSAMLIKNWSFGAPTYPGDAPYSYAFKLAENASLEMVPPPLGFGSVAYGDLTNIEGLSGQNSHRSV